MPDTFALDPPAVTESALFPTRDKRQRWEDRLTQALIGAGERVAAGSVTPDFDPEAFRRELAGFDFAAAQSLDRITAWTVAQLEHGVTHMTHPRYFGLFNPAPTFPAQCADRIAAAFNPQLATATTSPAAVAIEAHVIAAVARRAGLPDGTAGHFTSGGAEANCTALICALTTANEGFAARGARAFAGQPVFYVSKESHLAWFKIAHQAGIGRDSVRLVATDGSGRLDPRALTTTITEDRAAGHVPVMVAATAGTTNAGMIDPLEACAEIARHHGLWFHVDAAWGGALIASQRHRAALTGIETADSLTIDAHKWVRRDDGLRHVFHTVLECLGDRVPGGDELHAVARRGLRPVPQFGAVVAPVCRASPVHVARRRRLGRLCSACRTCDRAGRAFAR